MQNINFTVLENSKINILHRRIYGHMHLWPEIDFKQVYWKEYYGTGIRIKIGIGTKI